MDESNMNEIEKKLLDVLTHLNKLIDIQKIDPLSPILGIRRNKPPTRKFFSDLLKDDKGNVDQSKVEFFFGKAADRYAKSIFYGTRGNSNPLDYLNGPKNNWAGYDTSTLSELQNKYDKEENLKNYEDKERFKRGAAKERGEQILAKHKANRNFTWWYDHLNEYDKKFFDLTQRYGGGEEGRRMAKDKMDEDYSNERKEKESNQSTKRWAGKRNFIYDTMDEYDQKIHDLTQRYGGNKRKADESIRNNALKGIPKIMQKMLKLDSISTKQLFKISNGINSFPLIVRLAKLAKSPVGLAAIGVGAIMKANATRLENQDKSITIGARSRRAGLNPVLYRAANTALGLVGGNGDSYASVVHDHKASIGGLRYGGSTQFLEDLAIRGIDIRGSGRYGLLTEDERINRVSQKIKELRETGMEEEAIELANNQKFDAAMYDLASRYGGNASKFIKQDAFIDPAKSLQKREDRDYEEKLGREIMYSWWEMAKNNVVRVLTLEPVADAIVGDPVNDLNKIYDAAASLDNYQRNGGDYSVGAYGSSGDKTTTKIYQLNGDIITDADNIKKLAADAEGKTEIIDRYEESVSADTKRSR